MCLFSAQPCPFLPHSSSGKQRLEKVGQAPDWQPFASPAEHWLMGEGGESRGIASHGIETLRSKRFTTGKLGELNNFHGEVQTQQRL